MLFLALFMLVLLTAVAMLTRPITPIDETRYVGVAWEMWLRGDFLVPFKNGEPYSHKPPLMMWMFHAGWAVFGVNEWWPRLVSPLFSAASILLTYTLSKRLWPERADIGGHAAVVLASCLVWAFSSTVIMFDVMLAFFVLTGMHGALIAADGRPARGFVLLGLSIGLGVLAKGPVILLQMLPVVVLAPWWNPGLRWMRWSGGVLAAVLLGAAIALAWAIPAGMAGGEEYRNAIFWGQTANRMVESFAHQRPFWWYLAILPLLLFPWFIWPMLWRAASQYAKLGLDRGGRFCIAWTVPVFVAFSLVSGKQVHYLMPLFPAFALLVARVVLGYTAAVKQVSGLGFPSLILFTLGIGLIVVASGGIALPPDEVPILPPLWPGIVLAIGALITYGIARKFNGPIPVLGLLAGLFLALIQFAARPMIYPVYDIHPLAHAIDQAQQAGHKVAHAGKYHNQYHFFGRLQQPLVALHGPEKAAWLAQNPSAYVVLYEENLNAFNGVSTVVTQRYRGKAAALLDAKSALTLLQREGEPRQQD